LAALGVVGCLAFPAISNAAPPTQGGINCQNDGHIDGRGSTLQDNLQELVWNKTFQNDVCGPLPNSTAGNSTLPDGATVTLPGQTMIAYNYGSAFTTNKTGSGAGILGAECRTDAFWGTDVPYSSSQYTTMQGGGETTTTCSSLNGVLTPPFTPNGTFPAAGDNTAAGVPSTGPSVMSFPVAAAAVNIMINLGTAAGCSLNQTVNTQQINPSGCTASPPIVSGCPSGGLEFTGQQISEIMGGDVTNWDQLSSAAPTPGVYGLASESPADDGLATCNLPLVRVVRKDNSGTTNILQNYLIDTDNARNTGPETTQQCPGTVAGTPGTAASPPETWSLYQAWPGGSNASWPGFPNNPSGPGGGEPTANTADGTCSNLFYDASSGGPGLFAALQGVSGGVGYLDLSDAVDGSENQLTIPVQSPTLLSGDGSSYQPAQSGAGANCVVGTALPAGGPTPAVGLKTTDDWANNNGTNHDNIANFGSKYPLCGLTWQLVYTQEDGGGTEGAGPVSTLSSDQRQTLYSYINYELGSTAQGYLSKNNYAPLPATWIPTLVSGFQAQF
jgi:ABC-type phosphate transport system substrate-binding protein